MLQELAARTQATSWAIGSMLFFLVVWVVIMVRVFRTSNDALDAQAQLVLDDGAGGPTEGSNVPGTTD